MGFYASVTSAGRGCAEDRQPLGFTRLATLGLVAKLFVVKKQLLACSEDKVRAAVDAFQHSVLEFHRELLQPSNHGKHAANVF